MAYLITKHSYIKKLLAISILAGATISTHAQANVFAPLLKKLLPFYNPSETIEFQDDVSAFDTQSVPNNTKKIFKKTTPKKTTHNSSSKPEPSLYALLNAEFLYDRGHIKEALEIYKHEAFGKSATSIFERALALSLKHENIHQSLKFASKWQQQNPNHIPGWFYVAHLALQAHEYELAGETLSHILDFDPKADFSKISQGIYSENEKDQRELLTTLQKLNSEQNPTLSILQANLLLKFNTPEVALFQVNRALKLEPENLAYIILKADILKCLNRSEELLKFLAKARIENPEERDLYLYEVEYRLDTKRLQENDTNTRIAWKLLVQASEKFAEDPEIILRASIVSLDLEEYKKGDELLILLLDRPAYTNKAYYQLGISAEKQRQYKKAKYYFSRVEGEDESLIFKASKKIVAYELINNNIDAAIEILVKVRNSFEMYAPESYILQASILREQKKITEAKSLLVKAIQEYPESALLQLALIELLDDKTEYTTKLKSLKSLLKKEPDNLSYQFQYAKLLLKRSSRSLEAKRIIERIVSIPYNDPRFNKQQYLDALNLLASIALEKKQYKKVIDYLETPYEILPNLASGVLLLEGYRGIDNQKDLQKLQNDLKKRFGYKDKTQVRFVRAH